MAKSIYFESYFRKHPYINTFKPDNYKEWTIEEKWSVTQNEAIQEITLVNEDDFFESYYYVDLEIVSAFEEHDAKILKSERMASNNINFLIRGEEFSCFQAYCGIVVVDNENDARLHKFRYKITLTPILQLYNEPFRNPGKRTKIDLLPGLKILSNDIVSMKGKLFSDIIIYCGNKKVKAHRNILSTRSTVFKKFLQGVEDEEVESCLELESAIDERDSNSINNNSYGGDNPTPSPPANNDSDAKDIHIEEDNRVQLNLNVESETDADEDSTTIDAEKDKVQSCFEVESAINERDVDSINDNLDGGDNPTNNGSDAASIHSEENNRVTTVNMKLKVDADEATNGNKDSKTIRVKKDETRKARSFLEMKLKSNNDITKDDNYCTIINAKKNNKIQNTLGIKQKIADDATVDDSKNDGNDTTVIYLKKDSEVQHYLEIKSPINDYFFEDYNFTNDNDDSINTKGAPAMWQKKDNEIQNKASSKNDGNDTTVIYLKKDSEAQHYLGIKSPINDYFFEDDNFTNDNDDSINTNGALAMWQKKDNEIQNKASSNSIDKESETPLKAGTSISARPIEVGEDIQYGIELESDDDDDILSVPADESNEVQNNAEIQPEYASNNNEILPPIIEEDDVQSESESGESDNSSRDNILKIRLKKIPPSIFREFIDFIYSGQYNITDIKKTKDLLIAGRNYGICDLEYKCIMYLRSQISVETCDNIYNFASVCGCDDLRIYVLDYLKNKIVGRRRRNIQLVVQMIEQGNGDIGDEEGMTTDEIMRWLNVMKNYQSYFRDILKFKKGKKIRQLFSIIFPEISFDYDVIMEDCRERLEYILNRI